VFRQEIVAASQRLVGGLKLQVAYAEWRRDDERLARPERPVRDGDAVLRLRVADFGLHDGHPTTRSDEGCRLLDLLRHQRRLRRLPDAAAMATWLARKASRMVGHQPGRMPPLR
jgi:hypothetical protein